MHVLCIAAALVWSTTESCDLDSAVFHLEKYTRGGKMILIEKLGGGPRDCARQRTL